MRFNLKISKDYPLYLIVTGIFLIIISPGLLSEGMFMDGIVYSTISKNLASGIGSFWNPHFTSTCFPVFHDHPPLAFWIQSVFYKLFGESLLIEKFYSLFTYIIVGYNILRIWKIFKLK